MDYAGGPAGLTRSHVGTCPLCGWTGPGRDAPFHDCNPPADIAGRSLDEMVRDERWQEAES